MRMRNECSAVCSRGRRVHHDAQHSPETTSCVSHGRRCGCCPDTVRRLFRTNMVLRRTRFLGVCASRCFICVCVCPICVCCGTPERVSESSSRTHNSRHSTRGSRRTAQPSQTSPQTSSQTSSQTLCCAEAFHRLSGCTQLPSRPLRESSHTLFDSCLSHRRPNSRRRVFFRT